MVQILKRRFRFRDLAPDSKRDIFFLCFLLVGKAYSKFCVWGGDNEKEIYGNPDGLSIYHYCNLIVSSRNVPISLDVAVPQMSST